jgi:hypothetical protein
MQVTKSKWFMSLFAVALGVIVFIAQWTGGDPRSGLVSFAILAGAGLLVLLGGRSETIRGLRGDGSDERATTATPTAGSAQLEESRTAPRSSSSGSAAEGLTPAPTPSVYLRRQTARSGDGARSEPSEDGNVSDGDSGVVLRTSHVRGLSRQS